MRSQTRRPDVSTTTTAASNSPSVHACRAVVSDVLRRARELSRPGADHAPSDPGLQQRVSRGAHDGRHHTLTNRGGNLDREAEPDPTTRRLRVRPYQCGDRAARGQDHLPAVPRLDAERLDIDGRGPDAEERRHLPRDGSIRDPRGVCRFPRIGETDEAERRAGEPPDRSLVVKQVAGRGWEIGAGGRDLSPELCRHWFLLSGK
jgi:hypothetical protein